MSLKRTTVVAALVVVLAFAGCAPSSTVAVATTSAAPRATHTPDPARVRARRALDYAIYEFGDFPGRCYAEPGYDPVRYAIRDILQAAHKKYGADLSSVPYWDWRYFGVQALSIEKDVCIQVLGA